MGKSVSTPAVPDYTAAAKEQGVQNQQSALQSSILSNPNMITPYGSQTVSYSSPTFDEAGYNKALQGYQKINELALRKIKKNGLLFTYSCSQVITRDLFYNMLVAAGIAVGREIQVIHQMTQSPDHPINLFHPESNYLKGFVLKVL